MSDDPIRMMEAINQEMAAEYQWQLLVEFIGNEHTAARVMGATPMFGGLSKRAKELLDE